MNATAIGTSWKLEVVRGKDVGRVFAPGLGEVVIGNAPGDRGGIDLSDQEGESSTRKMASRQALMEVSATGLAIRDLESPGGTFVNRQRVLPGQSKTLRAGDLIQLAGVQLKVVEDKAPTPAPTSIHAGPMSYAIPGGSTCRTWDDFLAGSSQRWEALREELISGRLAGYLTSIGRGDLAPSTTAPGTPDDRLDTWLGALPTTREARPELDVHPAQLVVRVQPGGGTIRRSVRVSNVGYRLLRSTARIEPAGTSWIALTPEFAGQTFATVEGTDLSVEIAIPETLPQPLRTEIVVEGNGGSKRVAVVLEEKSASGESFEAKQSTVGGPTLSELIARQSPVARAVSWGLAALALRLVIGVAGGSLGEDAMKASGADTPRLLGVGLMLASIGGLAGGLLAARRGGRGEGPTGAFAGAFSGLILAAALVATCWTFEPWLGPWSTSVIAVGALWIFLGSGLGALMTLFVKAKT